MDVRNSIDGSLQISNEVVAKIAKLAALEIDGVADVSSGSMQSVRGLLSKASLQKACYGGFKRWRCCGAGARNCQVRQQNYACLRQSAGKTSSRPSRI